MAIGALINLKAWVKSGHWPLTTKADLSQVLNTEMVKNGLRMAMFMKVPIQTISPVDWENTSGKMDHFMKGSSKTDFAMEKGCGNLGRNPTKEITSTTKKADKEFITGPTAKLIIKGPFMKIWDMATDKCFGTIKSQHTKENGNKGFRMDMDRYFNFSHYQTSLD